MGIETQEETLKMLLTTIDSLRERVASLEAAARQLRSAQRNYMANRGNQEAGKAVAVAAKELDQVLGDA
jgi:hypothetical protein